MGCESRGFLRKMDTIFDFGELNEKEKVNMQVPRYKPLSPP